MLMNPDVLSEVENGHARNDGVLGDFCDANFVRTHPIFQETENALQIVAYYDEIEVANPLGSKSSKHKLGCFYWALGNIRPKYRSSLRTIQLFAIANYKEIKKHGINQVLQPFVDDINKLANDEGVQLKTFHGYQTFRGALVAFLGDTPAANYVGGFKEGVGGAMRMCRTCYCHRNGDQNEIVTKMTHNDCQIRELHKHVRHTMDVTDPSLTPVARSYWSKFWGINDLSVLHQARFFDVCQCLPHDVMHILLEGIVTSEIKLVLRHAIDDLGLFTINWLNGQVQQMNLTGLEAKDRPSPIDRIHLNSNGHKLNQSSAQVMTLCNILPYIIGKLFTNDDQHWYCLRLLLQITNISLANELKTEDATTLATLIQEHHHLFLSLYGAGAVTPKWHYMVHLPNQILTFGPLRIQWCMRFEAKHHFFKQAMVRKSYKNVPMSMAYHHAYFSCYQLLLNDGQQGSNYLYSGDTHLLDERPFDIPVGLEEAMNEATNAGDISFSLAIHADRHGIKFAVGNVVCLSTEEGDLPSFGFVTRILIFDENLVFLVQRAITDHFDCNYLAYQIQKINEMCIVALEELAHSIPLFPQTISGNVFVNLRHSRVSEFLELNEAID